MKKLLVCLLLVSLCGCTGAQVRQEFIGLSVSDVMNSKTRQTQQYDISSDKCIAKIKETLTEMKAIVREDRKNNFIYADNLQKAYKPCINTTEVGIVVTPWQVNKSQVDVASGNNDLAIFVSKKISEKIKGKPEQPAVKEAEEQAIK